MWLPGATPLLLETPTIGLEQRGVLAARHELSEGGFTEVMDEHVLGADDSVVRLVCPSAVVIVLKHAHREALVKWTEPFVRVTAHCQTEHGEHRNVETAPGVGARSIGGEMFETAECPVRDLDLRLVASRVGQRTNEAHCRLDEVLRQASQPLRRHECVVVEQNQHVTTGQAEALVDSRGKTAIGGVEQQAEADRKSTRLN